MDNYIKLLNKVLIILLTVVSLSNAQSTNKTTKDPLLALHVDENSIIPVPEIKFNSVESHIWMHFKNYKKIKLVKLSDFQNIKDNSDPSIIFLNKKYGITHSLKCEFSIVTATSIDTLYSVAMVFKYIKNTADSMELFTKGNFQKIYPSKIDSCLGIIDEYFKKPFYCSKKFWIVSGGIVITPVLIVFGKKLYDYLWGGDSPVDRKSELPGVPDFP